MYGLEVVLPKTTLVEKLERTYKHFIKQILSLLVTVSDPAVYILAGAIPIEAVIHKRALVLFGSLCRLGGDSVEKRVARRQLCVKSFESNSWFTAVCKLFFRYDLLDCWNVVDTPPSKLQWKSLVHMHANAYWVDRIKATSLLYSSLEYLTADDSYPGNKHCLLQHSGIARNIPCIHDKLKLVTGTYILQVNRSAFNQKEIDPTCPMCMEESKTVEHFLVKCSALAGVRQPIMDSIVRCVEGFMQTPIETEFLVKVLLNSAGVFSDLKDSRVKNAIKDIKKLSKRLCYVLHT